MSVRSVFPPVQWSSQPRLRTARHIVRSYRGGLRAHRTGPRRAATTRVKRTSQLLSSAPSECTSGHPAQVGYSDPARAIGEATRHSWARAWVVWGDTIERQLRTCEWDRAVARYLAFNGRRSGTRLAPVVLMSHRRTNTDRGRFFSSSRDPRPIARIN